MPHEDYVLVADAIRATVERIRETRCDEQQLWGVRRTAAHIATALYEAHGVDQDNFLKVCGFRGLGGGITPVETSNG